MGAATIDFKVVGLTFTTGRVRYPDNLHALAALHEKRQLESISGSAPDDPSLPVVLIRNPDNKFDVNAIEVHVPALGRDGMIGHVPAPLAARLAPRLDAGEVWDAKLERVLIDQSHLDKPGAAVVLTRS